MKKTALILAVAVALMALPVRATEQAERELVENELQQVGIAVNGSQIHVTGANGQTLEIYDIAGVRVASIRIDSDDKTLNLHLNKGCYILKVGKVVRKINIR